MFQAVSTVVLREFFKVNLKPGKGVYITTLTFVDVWVI